MTSPSAPSFDLSLVIPAQNEESRLPATLTRISRLAQERALQIEVIIADDGSTDATPHLAQSAPKNLTTRVLPSPRAEGPGAAVKRGVLASRGVRVLICDADGPVPFADLRLLEAALDAGAQVAAGSRALARSSILRSQPPHRVWMGKVWRRAVRSIAPTGVSDTQCGFKLLEHQAAHRIFERAQEPGFVFHVEALLIARSLGYTITEVPIRWSDAPGSKVRLLQDSLTMLASLLRLSRRHARQLKRSSPEISHAH